MSITNETFSTDLNGWNHNNGSAVDVKVVWDNGRVKLTKGKEDLTECPYQVPCGAPWLSQRFLIDREILSFDWEAYHSTYAPFYRIRSPSYNMWSLTVHTPTGDVVVVSERFDYAVGYLSGSRSVNLSVYKGYEATILFQNTYTACCSIFWYPWFINLWIDNVKLTGSNIIPINIVPSVTTCTEPCNANIDVTWQNTGELSGTFEPTISVNDIPIKLSAITLNPGETTPTTFVLTGLTGGINTICAESATERLCTTINVINTGSLDISSTPRDATVILNGTDTGRITPATIPDLTTGTYTLTLRLDGYREYTETIEIFAGQTTTISVILEPLTGSLDISSTPRDATVILNGTDTGRITPATIPDLTIGTYTLTLRLDGYREYTETIEIFAGQTTTISVTLEPLTGSLDISSTPQGAAIILNGTDTDKVTQAVIPNLTAGTYTLTLTLDGHKDYTETIQIFAGQTTTISVTLEPLTGSLDISSTPQGAAIILNGTDTGRVTPATIPDLTIGFHILTLTLYGHKEHTETIQIFADQITTISVTLEPLTGDISFTSTPTGAKIYIDEKDTGLFTPVTVSKITAGPHTYRLSKFAYFDSIGTIEVIPDTTISLSITMTPMTTTCQIFNSVPIGSRIIIDGWDLGAVTPINLCGIPYGYHYYDLEGTFTIEEKGRPVQPFVTVPKGARIYVDDVYMGETPNVIKDLSPGVHKYRLIGTIRV